MTFSIILLTNQPTNKQTKQGKFINRLGAVKIKLKELESVAEPSIRTALRGLSLTVAT